MKTKSLYSTVILVTAMLTLGLLYGCSSTGPAASTPAGADPVFNSLLDMLRLEPGLMIQGNGANATVTMRGTRTFEGNNEPLFVLDGTPLGYGYGGASSIDVTQVESIRVLSPSQSGLYGARGSNGVVQIRMKN